MKLLFLFFLLLFFVPGISAQEIQLNAPLMATAGSGTNAESVSISKWRLGEVHLIVLDQREKQDLASTAWKVAAYPNPCTESINVQFYLTESNEMMIQVTDLTGKKQLVSARQLVSPGQTVFLDLSHLASGMYLLSVLPTNEKAAQIMKIQKM